jgi:hypothetical protein
MNSPKRVSGAFERLRLCTGLPTGPLCRPNVSFTFWKPAVHHLPRSGDHGTTWGRERRM